MSEKDNFIKGVKRLVDKWSFDHCAYCDPGTLVSVDGMIDFKCINCGKRMKAKDYLGEIARLVYEYRERPSKGSDKAGE